MRKRLIVLSLLAVSLLCSGYIYKGDRSKIEFTVSEDYVSDDDFLGTVKLNGNYIKLPCTTNLLLDQGFTVEDKFSRFNPLSTSYSSDLYDNKGRCLELVVENNEDKYMDIKDCNVYEIEYDGTKDESYGYIDFSVQGVKVGDSVSTAKSILGEPGSTWTYEGITYATYETPKKDVEIELGYDSIVKTIKVTVDSPDQEYQYAHELDTGMTFDTPTDQVPIHFNVHIFFAFIGVAILIVLGTIAGIVVYALRKQKHEQDMEILNTPIDEEDDDT